EFSGISVVLGAAIQVTGVGQLSMTGTPGVNGDQVGNGLSLASAISVANSSVTLIGDTMFLDPANLTLNAATVTLLPKSAVRAIDLGSAAAGDLGLGDDELDTINAGTVNIGDANSGTITVNEAIDRALATALNLTTAGSVNFTTGSLDSGGGDVKISNSAG